MNVSRRRRPSLSRLRAIVRPRGLAAAISIALSATLPIQSAYAIEPQVSRISAIDPGTSDPIDFMRKTNTSITHTGNIFDIISATKSADGKTAFNSFNHFELVKADTVNFLLDGNSSNVVNLVWDSRAYINGTMNSYLLRDVTNGQNTTTVKTLGGNVFFADPHGIVIGQDAVLNVGSLSLSAPSTSQMDELMGVGGLNTGAAGIQAILEGRERLGGTADANDSLCTSMICVNGVVNASNAVRVRATTIDVDGTIATTGLGASTLGTAVNVEDANGNSSMQVVQDGNTIRLIAEDYAVSDAGIASAHAAVNVSGTLQTGNATAPTGASDSFGNIDVTAVAGASSDYGTPAITSPATRDIGDLWRDRDDFAENGLAATVANVNIATAELGMQAGFVLAKAKAEVTISGTVDASGDINIASSTDTSATTDAATLAFKSTSPGASINPLAITVMYGGLDSRANTNVTNTATLSGGNVNVAANTSNALEVSASTRVGAKATQAVATTVSISQAHVDASVNMAGQVTADALTLDANNTSDFKTQAATFSDDGLTPVGLAVAFSDPSVSAKAIFANNVNSATNVIGAGGVMVNALSDTTGLSTSASNKETPAWMKLQEPEGKAPKAAGSNLTGSVSNVSSKAGKGLGAALPFKVGAAVSWTDSDQSANASVGADVKLSTTGNASVTGTVRDQKIHGEATSNVLAKTQSGSAAPVAISAALNYGNYSHDARAGIGRNAQITATNIGVQSQVLLPFDWTFGFSAVGDMGRDFESFKKGAELFASIVSPTANPLVANATGFANASTPSAKDSNGNETQGEVGISGSVNYTEVHNNSHAWVDSGARLTATSNLATADAWVTELPDGSKVNWTDSIHVSALAQTGIFSLIGEVRPWALLNAEGKIAAGGAFNYTGLQNITTAGIASGAVIESAHNDAAVTALSKNTVFALSPVAGKGDSLSLQGTVALSDVNDATHASVSAASKVTARTLTVQARNPLTVWSVSGAIALSKESAIGISIGINRVNTDTVALIGDNHKDGTDPNDNTLPQTGGLFSVNALNMEARTTGETGGVSVAGAISRDSGQQQGGAQKGGGADGMIKLIKKISGLAGTLQGAIDSVDSAKQVVAPDDPTADDSMLSKASEYLGQVSEGVSKAGALLDKVQSFGGKTGQTPTPPAAGAAQPKAGLGIGVSGAASVNIAKLGTRAELQGATVDNTGNKNTEVTVQAVNTATQISVAGAASMKLGGSNGGGGGSSANIGGAVAYSKIDDNTRAWISDSKLIDTSKVAVRALDGSTQIGVGVGASVNTSGGSGTSATLAGSVSIGQSRNTTESGISDSTLDAGTTGTVAGGRALEVVAYDHSRIGLGAGALSLSTGSNNNGAALGLTYADISNKTSASVTGHAAGNDLNGVPKTDVQNFARIGVQALDSSLIGAGVLTGTVSNGSSRALSGAFIWNSVKNTGAVTIGNGVRISSTGDMQLRSAAVESGVDVAATALDSVMDKPAQDYGYDFKGNSLAYTGSNTHNTGGDSDQPDINSLQATGWGSSIIAVAGSIAIGGNNVGLSFVGSQVANTHTVDIGHADLQLGGDLSLDANDNTRIIGLAVGAGVTNGSFTGMGSATYNDIGNTDLVRFGHGLAAGEFANVRANNITATALDRSRIYSLAGNVAIGTGTAAGSGAVTYNKIDNEVGARAGSATLGAVNAINFNAKSDAMIMSGAVAAAGAASTALSLSFAWNETSSDTYATAATGSTFKAKSLNFTVHNDSDIYTLSGAVAISGDVSPAAAGSVAEIADQSRAALDGSTLDIADSIKLSSSAEGDIYSLAVGIAASSKAAISGSFTFATIDNDVTASAKNIKGVRPSNNSNPNGAVKTGSLEINAVNDAAINSLATAVAAAAYGSVGVGVTVADIGGNTSAKLEDSVLGVRNTTQVTAHDTSVIRTLAAGGSVGLSGGAASNSTNLINNQITAGMSGVGTDAASDGSQLADIGQVTSNNVTTISASNSSRIDSLAGAVSFGAFGAATAVNRIATVNDAYFSGNTNGSYRVRSMTVAAGANNANGDPSANGANINTVSVGGAVGGGASLAGSLSINLMDASNTARIDGGATVIADHDVGVLASNDQGINVLAGSVASGGGTSVGLGIVVNHVSGNTSASISNSDVTAYGRGASGISVDSGVANNVAALDDQIDIRDGALPAMFSTPAAGESPNVAGVTPPDLSGVKTIAHGVVVNSVNTQHIATLSVGLAAGTTAVGAQLGVNVVGGTSEASISNSNINVANRDADGTFVGVPTSTQQMVDVRAVSRQHNFNRVFEVAVGTNSLGAGIVANVFDSNTRAGITGSDVFSMRDTNVVADSDQWSMTGVAGLAASPVGTGGAASVGVNVFKSTTKAVLGDSTLKVGSLDVTADTHTAATQLGGAIGVSPAGVGIAGVVLVNVNQTDTQASINDNSEVQASVLRAPAQQDINGNLVLGAVLADGTVKVTANSSNRAQSAGAGGGLGKEAGIAGVATINVIGGQTHADVDGSVINASALDVVAHDAQDIDVMAGALGIGTVGIGGGLNLVLLQSSVGAQINNATVTTATGGDVLVRADSDRHIDSQAVALSGGAVSAGISVGVIVAGTGDIGNGGQSDAGSSLTSDGQVNTNTATSAANSDRVDSDTIASFGTNDDQISSSEISSLNDSARFNLASATGSSGSAAFGASDGIQANILGSTVTSGRNINISAEAKASTRNRAGAIAVGGVSIGGSVAYTSINTDVRAMTDNSVLAANNGINVTSKARDGNQGAMAETQAMIGVGGLAGIGAAVSVSRIKNTVRAEVGGKLSGNGSALADNALTVTASDSSSATAGNLNPSISVGGAVAGAVVVRADRDSTVTARLASNADISSFNSTGLLAQSSGKVRAEAFMGAGGILASGIGVDGRANDESTVLATVDGGADLSKTGAVNVSATASPDAQATVEGISVGGGISIGVNIARASVGTSVDARVGNGARMGGGALTVEALLDAKSKSKATAGSGGIGVSISSAEATSTNTSHVQANVGDSVQLPSGSLSIIAASRTAQTADSTGITIGGLLAVGNVVSNSSSNVETLAGLGNGNGQNAATKGFVTIGASGFDTNEAGSSAGSGALISGNGSQATTSSDSTTRATIGANQKLQDVTRFDMYATHAAAYGGAADSIQASLVGGSGAEVNNHAASTTEVNVGDNTNIAAKGLRLAGVELPGDISLIAESTFNATARNGGATGGSGGVISGQSAKVNTDLSARNNIRTGSNVALQTGGAVSDAAVGITGNDGVAGRLDVRADTLVSAITDSAVLSVSGAISGAEANVSMSGDFGNDISIGNSNNFNAGERANVVTYTRVDNVSSEALANTVGVLGTLAIARAKSIVTNNQNITIGSNSTVFSLGEANVVAGRDVIHGTTTQLFAGSLAQAFARGLVAIPSASANTQTNSNANLNLQQGARVISAGDVGVGSTIGQSGATANGTGHGYQLGFIPVTVTNSHLSEVGSANAKIDGAVIAGLYNRIKLDVDANGNVISSGSGAPVGTYLDRNINPSVYLRKYQTVLTGVDHSLDQYGGFDNVATGGLFIGAHAPTAADIANGKAPESLIVGGGNVYLQGGNVSGSGSITAKGAPEITINNASPYYVFLPSMKIGLGTTGQVITSGGATLASVGGIGVSQSPSDAEPAITVRSTYNNGIKTPGIATLGEIENRGGSVTLDTEAGSILSLGSIYANVINMSARQGTITLNGTPNVTMGTTSERAILPGGWLWDLLSPYTDGRGYYTGPDQIAASIAQSHYFGGVDAVSGGAMSGWLLGQNRATPYSTPSNRSSWDNNATDRTPIVLYGFCRPFVGGEFCNYGSQLYTAYPFFNPDGENKRYGPRVDWNPLSKVGTVPQVQGSGYYAQQLNVVAGTNGYININTPVFVGTPATWTLETTDALKTWQAQQSGNVDIVVPLYDAFGNPLMKVIDGGGVSRLIGTDRNKPVKYNPATGQLILPDITATGNGAARFDGRIVSTGGGSINVSSGYGSVSVKNETGKVLQVNNILAGNGGRGVIEIKDRLLGYTTWYVSENGEQAKIYRSSTAASWVGLPELGAVVAGTSYAPKAGQQYVWGARTDIFRNENDLHWTAGTRGNGTNGVKWTVTGGYFRDGAAVVGGGVGNHAPTSIPGGSDYVAALTGTFSETYYAGVHYHGCGDDINDGCNFQSRATGHDGANGDTPMSRWLFINPIAGRLTLNVTQRADKDIGINFDTSRSNHVTIDSNADVTLNGNILNTHGPTYIGTANPIGATVGNITQNSDKTVIWTHELAMRAQDARATIGTSLTPINVRIGHDGQPVTSGAPITVPTNALIAISNGGAININVDSGYAAQGVYIDAKGGNSAAGDVSLVSTGSVVGLTGFTNYRGFASNGYDITGNNVDLTSSLGGIGSAANPLDLYLLPDYSYNGARLGGVLNAFGYSDIAITNHLGDLWVGGADAAHVGPQQKGVVSSYGDVLLASPDGGIYDARMLSSASTLDLTKAREVWDRLHLTDGQADDMVVASVTGRVEAAYGQYWQLRSAGSVVNGAYELGIASVSPYFRLAALAAGLDPNSIADPAEQARMAQEYSAGLYDRTTGIFAMYVGNDWAQDSAFSGSQPTVGYQFAFDTNSELYKQLTHDSNWSEGQLRQAINSVALAIPSGGQVGNAAANVSGRDVTLTAGKGSIGRVLDRLSLSYADLYAGQLSTEQEGALALANAPGDALLHDVFGNIISPDDVRLDPGNPAFDANFLNRISLGRLNPLYVEASGDLKGSARDSVYLQTSGDLRLGGLSSGGNMRLAAGGNIEAAKTLPANTTAITAGGDATLTAGSGHISFGNGTVDGLGDALPVQINGTLLAVSAATNVLLSQMQGDLRFGTAFGNGRVSLSAPQGSILGTLPSLSIVGHDIDLVAAGDIQGPAGATPGSTTPLQVQVGSDGLLNATAGGAVNLQSPDFALHIGRIDAGENIDISTPQSGVDAQTLISRRGGVSVISAGNVDLGTVGAEHDINVSTSGALSGNEFDSNSGHINLDAVTGMTVNVVDATAGNVSANVSGTGAAFNLGNNGLIHAGGNLDLTVAGALTMGSGSSIDVGNRATLVANDDMTLGLVGAGGSSGNVIDLQSGGSIHGNGATVNLLARGGGNTQVLSEGDIGAQSQAFTVDVATLNGRSNNGSIWLNMLGDIAISSLAVPNGDLQATGAGDVAFDQILVSGSASLTGANLDGNNFDSQEALITAIGSAAINSLNTSGDAAVDAGQGIGITTLASGGNAALNAGTDLGVRTLTSGGNAMLNSGADSDIGTATVGGNLALTAGNDAHIGTSNVSGTGVVDATGKLVLDTYQGGDALTTTSDAGSTFGDVTLAAGDLISTAGTTFDATTLTVQAGNADLSSGTSSHIANATVGGNSKLNAGTDLVITTLTTGGNALFASGTDSDIGTATVGGNLASTTGNDAHIGISNVGGTGLVDANGNLMLGIYQGGDSLTTTSDEGSTFGYVTLAAGDLASTAGTTLDATTLTVQSGNADLTSGASSHIASATVGGNAKLHAGTDLGIATLASGGNALLNSGTDSDIGTATVGGSLALTAGNNAHIGSSNVGGTGVVDATRNLVLNTYQGGDALTTTSGAASNFGDVAIASGNLTVTAGSHLSANTVHVTAGNANLSSSESTNLGSVKVSGNTSATAGTTLNVDLMGSGGNGDLLAKNALTFGTVDAGLNLTGTSTQASITGGTANAGVDLVLTAADGIHVQNLSSGNDTRLIAGGVISTGTLQAGHDAWIRAGGDVSMQSTTAGNTIDVDSGGALKVGDASAGHSVAFAAETIDFGGINAPDIIDLHARNGNIIGAKLATRDAFIAARNDITLDAASIGNRINMQGTNITANIFQTSTQETIYSWLSGYKGSVATSITVNADIPAHWQIDRLSSMDAVLTSTGPDVSIESGHIEHTMALDTEKARIRMDQQDPRLVKADVQLMEPGFNFQYSQKGIHTLTDAYVVRYAYGYQIQTPNFVQGHAWLAPDYFGESVLRYNGRHLSARDQLFLDIDGSVILSQPASQEPPVVDSSPEGALNLSQIP